MPPKPRHLIPATPTGRTAQEQAILRVPGLLAEHGLAGLDVIGRAGLGVGAGHQALFALRGAGLIEECSGTRDGRPYLTRRLATVYRAAVGPVLDVAGLLAADEWVLAADISRLLRGDDAATDLVAMIATHAGGTRIVTADPGTGRQVTVADLAAQSPPAT